jgi:4-amino-4-deoxy-L-arabinose transferase-like glycosyltransferase
VLALRLAHLSSVTLSPLSYQPPGPDEEYYLRFGQAVAAGTGQNSPEFTSLDPGYGYLLGAIFKLVGVNLFAVYLLQALLDTATACGILVIGRLLGRSRAGLYGALVYGFTSTAIMYSAALLKEVWVASYVTWWAAGALALIRSERKLAWLLFGGYCALGIALRANLLLLGFLALLLPGLGTQQRPNLRSWSVKAALIACGMGVALLPWSVRNAHAFGGLSPLPHNGGISLHQVYNAQNPGAEFWIPPFVNYSHPSEIWRGYAAEASRRAGHTLTPVEVDHYWREAALGYIRQHPVQVLGEMLQKSLNFLSAEEVPDNRSMVEEKIFSPVLRLLPAATVWLLGMGLAGLIWMAIEDRRWPIIAAPIFVTLLTVAIFFETDRFRFHAATMLALCSGVWIDRIIQSMRDQRKWPALGFAAAASVVAAVSLYLGSKMPPPTVRWDQIAWGYIKMGKIPEARALAERTLREQPNNGAILEALGFTAIEGGQYSEAAQDYQRAIELRPRSHLAHYNLARLYLKLGDFKQAEREAKIAVTLDPEPDYQALLRQIEAVQ